MITTSDRTAAAGRGSVLLALRKVHPLDRRQRRFDRRRHGRDLCDPPRALRADPRRHDPGRRAHPAADRPRGIACCSSRARAYDSASASAQHEFVRKARQLPARSSCSRELWLFNPRRNRLWLETMSHKALRLALPALHAALFAASAALAPGSIWFYQAAFAAQVVLRGDRRLYTGLQPASLFPRHCPVRHLPAELGDGRRICAFPHQSSAGHGTRRRARRLVHQGGIEPRTPVTQGFHHGRCPHHRTVAPLHLRTIVVISCSSPDGSCVEV